MNAKIKIGISACLLGAQVRYDGQHKLDHYLRDTLGQFVEWVPVCPEVEFGLPTPRDAMRLVGDPQNPRLVTIKEGIDHTDGMQAWAAQRLALLEGEELSGFIFKSKSPSSGMQRVKVYKKAGASPVQEGVGIFARVFIETFPLLPVEEEGRLHDPILRENFITRIFVFKRWGDFCKEDGSINGLVDFHSDHKLLIMAHSQKMLRSLGRLVAHVKERPRGEVLDQYIMALMQGLKLHASAKQHVNVLQHIVGYFKKMLSKDEKKELLDVIMLYYKQYIPIVVPLTLLRHYVRKYNAEYLKRQHYLHPHPMELMLLNHV